MGSLGSTGMSSTSEGCTFPKFTAGVENSELEDSFIKIVLGFWNVSILFWRILPLLLTETVRKVN